MNAPLITVYSYLLCHESTHAQTVSKYTYIEVKITEILTCPKFLVDEPIVFIWISYVASFLSSVHQSAWRGTRAELVSVLFPSSCSASFPFFLTFSPLLESLSKSKIKIYFHLCPKLHFQTHIYAHKSMRQVYQIVLVPV